MFPRRFIMGGISSAALLRCNLIGIAKWFLHFPYVFVGHQNLSEFVKFTNVGPIFYGQSNEIFYLAFYKWSVVFNYFIHELIGSLRFGNFYRYCSCLLRLCGIHSFFMLRCLPSLPIIGTKRRFVPKPFFRTHIPLTITSVLALPIVLKRIMLYRLRSAAQLSWRCPFFPECATWRFCFFFVTLSIFISPPSLPSTSMPHLQLFLYYCHLRHVLLRLRLSTTPFRIDSVTHRGLVPHSAILPFLRKLL